MEATIRRLIGELRAAPPRGWEWLVPAIEEHDFLPLLIAWENVLGIRPDGTLVRWLFESEPRELREIERAADARLALVQGAKRYPELAALVPRRPPGTVTCGTCTGSGHVPTLPHVICTCGGAGWVVPGEITPQ